MTRSVRTRAVLAALCCLVALGVTPTATAHRASHASTDQLQRLAQEQTNLLLKFYQGENVSPPRCGQGQSSGGVRDVFLLPALSFGGGDRTITCRTSAGAVLLDLGGFVITEDDRFPESFYTFTDDGPHVPFTRANLEPICDDLIADGILATPAGVTLDGDDTAITGTLLNSGVFTAKVNRHAQIPSGPDLYADTVALGHPGRLATVFCGTKAVVALSPGTHTIVVDYGSVDDVATSLTFVITVVEHRGLGG